ncbi:MULTISPECIES: Ldh family oxidoreductase [unclassified Chelatococcus]|uniref:Ldh family oxidoreductase n=1 Tax=unclassified Chelatococcus TaxID=2638111 RepID=UPI001BD02AB2|nr:MULTISPECIES: Ldh family oxidoreductase [unclassified Chelatococcus]MBS7742447.1 Ldh family oxidoreductase [Chelatococcus sp. HY11]MBX3542435.1 Ldh family oxidoreductase [Chelatococcus sp.]
MRTSPFKADDLVDILTLIFRAAGCADDIAKEVADALVDADLSGHDTHGSRQVDFYVERLKRGEVDGLARPTIESDMGGLVRIAGNRAFGQIAGAFAARLGAERAARDGSCIVCLSGSGHLGRNGRWAEIAADRNVGSLHFGQGIPQSGPVAPHGGREGRLNTNPIALGLPGATPHEPIVLDCATSAVSGSTIKQAHDRGTSLDTPCLVKTDGTVTTDPAAFMAGDAAVMTFGGFKGFGLSVFSEILSTIVATAGDARPSTNSLFSIYFSVEKLMSLGDYEERLAAYRDRVVTCPPLPGVDTVMLPGDRSREARRRAAERGFTLTADTAQHVRRAAEIAGVWKDVAYRCPELRYWGHEPAAGKGDGHDGQR